MTLAISKELYVFNEEALIVISFASIAAVLFRLIKKPMNEWADEKIAVCSRPISKFP